MADKLLSGLSAAGTLQNGDDILLDQGGAELVRTDLQAVKTFVQAGAGDMLKSTYDPDNDGKVASAVNADAVPWTGVSGKPSTYSPSSHAATHGSAGSDPITVAQSQVTNLTTDLAAKAPLASPTFTGTPAVPTAPPGTNTTQAASTAFVKAAVDAVSASGLPAGGTVGQVLTKQSSTDGDADWEDSGGSGMSLGSRQVFFCEDFHRNVGSNGDVFFQSTFGGSITSGTSTPKHPGIARLGTGTSTTGTGTLAINSTFWFSSGDTHEWVSHVNITQLGDATNDFDLWVGFRSATNSTESTRGAWFTYSHDINGGKFLCTTYEVAGTTTDSGVTVVAGTWYTLRVVDDGTATRFYITDGEGGTEVLVATHTTNRPTGGNFPCLTQLRKSAGTTTCTVDVDYMHYKGIYAR